MKQENTKQLKQLATPEIAIDDLLLTMGWKENEKNAKEAFASFYIHFGIYLHWVCEKIFEKYRQWYNASLIDLLFNDVMICVYENPEALLAVIEGKSKNRQATYIKVELGKIARRILLRMMVEAEDPYRKNHISYDSTSTMHLLNYQNTNELNETEDEIYYRTMCESRNNSKEESDGESHGEFVSFADYNWSSLDTSEEEEVQDNTFPESNEVIISVVKELLTEREYDILRVSLEFGAYHKYLPTEIIENLCKRWQTTDVNVRQLRLRAIKKIKMHLSKKYRLSNKV